MLRHLFETQIRLLLRNRSILWITVLLPLLLHPVLAFGLGQLAWLQGQSQESVSSIEQLRADPRVQQGAGGRLLIVDAGETEAEARAATTLARRLREKKQSAAPANSTDSSHLLLHEIHIQTHPALVQRQLVSIAVILMLVLAMSWPALELTVSERNLGLSETLASTPLNSRNRSRSKILCIASIGLISLIAHGSGVSIALAGSGLLGSIPALPIGGILLASIGAISFVTFMGALFLWIGTLSAEPGEAHAWSWLVFVVLAASMLPVVIGVSNPGMIACFPGPGHALCLDAGLSGSGVSPAVVACLILTTLLTSVLVQALQKRLASFETELSYS
ncbi:MAG: hypothetical protein CSA62_12440 [Planctomycetota bacterium]|nr:MAG: hypothetical protein CSA62_12440 [Planctomycetota bacterium]